MKTRNSNLKNKTLAIGLIASALLSTGAGAAFADNGYHHAARTRGADVSGTVVVSKEIPGGVITVGATIGRERPVVVEERKVVIVKQEERCAPQKVVIVKEQPKVVVVHEAPRKVVVVKERPVEKVVIVKERGRNGKIVEKRIVTRGHDHDNGRWDRNDRNDRGDHHDRRDRDGHRGHDHNDRGGANRVVYVQK